MLASLALVSSAPAESAVPGVPSLSTAGEAPRSGSGAAKVRMSRHAPKKPAVRRAAHRPGGSKAVAKGPARRPPLRKAPAVGRIRI
jgi:hypothetical protein